MAHLLLKDAATRVAECFVVVGAEACPVTGLDREKLDNHSALATEGQNLDEHHDGGNHRDGNGKTLDGGNIKNYEKRNEPEQNDPNAIAQSPEPFRPSDSPFSQRFEAAILNRYPLDCKLPDGLEYFCFPEGLRVLRAVHAPRFHAFVHTSEVGQRMLGFVLIICEELTELQYRWFWREFNCSDLGTLFISKALCLLSFWPFVSSFKKFLLHLHRLSLESDTALPLERYICNFVDDVPAPPAGRVDVSYFLGDEPISFRCPPLNQPNAWCGFPLFPLFECLDAQLVLALFSAALVERQILFISSQYSLLTMCSEAVVSLLYPLSWAHAYIPILPARLHGVLGAPFPFILGIHSIVWRRGKSLAGAETVKVFLDHGTVDFGSLGPPPQLPEGRYRKLLGLLQQVVPWYDENDDGNWSQWHQTRLRSFDDATQSVSDNIFGGTHRPLNGKAMSNSETGFDYIAVREGFLKFFVSLLMNYKKYLVYPTDDSAVHDNFRFNDFLADHPAEWQSLLRELVQTQAFSQFVDQRVLLSKLDRDVIFFDESIDAKLNRYTFRMRDIDTPFLQDQTDLHVKTYVPPSPSTAGVDSLTPRPRVAPGRFPELQASLYVPPRHLAARFARPSDQLMGLLSRMRLKRKVAHRDRQPPSPAASMVFSSYLLCLSQLLSASLERLSQRPRVTILSTQRLWDQYGNDRVWGEGMRRLSMSEERRADDGPQSLPAAESHGADQPGNRWRRRKRLDDADELLRAARVALKVEIEALNTLIRFDYAPEEIVFRCLSEVCADLGESDSLLDLLVLMDQEGFIPDHQIRHALVRSLTPATDTASSPSTPSPDPAQSRLDPAAVWSYHNWQSLRREMALVTSRSAVPAQPQGSPRPFEMETSLTQLLWGRGVDNSSSAKLRTPSTSSRSEASLESDRWSANCLEGTVPSLRWDLAPPVPDQSVLFAASPKLQRLLRLSEQRLSQTFPRLHIDLASPFGMRCPGLRCHAGRVLTLGEVHQGWTASAGDAHKYTTRCLHCGVDFIPRFSVFCDVEGWQGSEGPGSALWCEMLSPWTLHKEVSSIVFEDGIHSLLLVTLDAGSYQRAVVFWNLLVAFRLRGLPYAFLLTDGSIGDSFPPNFKSVSIVG